MAQTAFLAVALASTAATAYSASEQNRSIRRSQREARRAAAVQTRQLGDQTRVEALKREQESQRAKAAIRAAAAGAGAEFDGSSYEALSTQAEFDRLTNENIADKSLVNNVNRVDSGLNANLDELASHRQNLAVATFLGGAQGAQIGYEFYRGAKGLWPEPNDPKPAVDPQYPPWAS